MNMIVDMRRCEITDMLKQLRELFSSCDNEADPLEVLVFDRKEANQARAFAAMSGYKAALCNADGHYRVLISGSSCGCFK